METQNLYYIGILFFITSIWLGFITVRQSRIIRRGKEIFTGHGKGDVYELLNSCLVKVKRVEESNLKVKNNLEGLIEIFKNSFQKIGVVRYNPLKDVGGNLSFTIALLDHKDNGIVITNIHSRDVDRLYAKPIKKGESDHNLSGEEREALSKAIKK